MKRTLSILVGFLLVFVSIAASIVWHVPYWYSFYVVGAFIFFGGLNYHTGESSVYRLVLQGKWRAFGLIYGASLLFGFFVDIVFGRSIGDLWYYPYWGKTAGVLIPVLFYYPFGGFQIYELFYFLHSIVSKKVRSQHKKSLNIPTKNVIATILIAFLPLGVLITTLNYFINQNQFANELVTLFIILTIFSSDAIYYKIAGKSLLFDLLEKNPVTGITMFLTWFIAAVLTEVPNTYSWEWIYHKVPFVHTEIFKINILIFTAGWFFLVFFPIRLIDILLYYLRKK